VNHEVRHAAKIFTRGEREAIFDYWTHERLANARPATLPGLDRRAKSNHCEAPAFGEAYPVDVNVLPYNAGGKLFFTDEKGEDHYGTAQFCGSGQMVLTAAHLVRDPFSGNYHTNILFIRAYDRGFGEGYTFERIKTHDKWIGENRGFDYAFGYTDHPAAYWVVLRAGGPYLDMVMIGYPENYDKETMWGADGRLEDWDSVAGIITMKESPMKAGSSGGAWLWKDYDRDEILALGLTAGGDEAEPLIEGPLFTQDILSLFHEVDNAE